MNRTYGCAPVYFAGAAVFFLSGGLFIYYGRPLIGAILLAPGFMLLALTFLAWGLISRLKRDDATAELVIKDPEVVKHVLQSQPTHSQAEKRNRRTRQKRTQHGRRKGR